MVSVWFMCSKVPFWTSKCEVTCSVSGPQWCVSVLRLHYRFRKPVWHCLGCEHVFNRLIKHVIPSVIILRAHCSTSCLDCSASSRLFMPSPSFSSSRRYFTRGSPRGMYGAFARTCHRHMSPSKSTPSIIRGESSICSSSLSCHSSITYPMSRSPSSSNARFGNSS